MAVHFVDPRADSAVAPSPYLLSAAMTDDSLSVGLLANGFPDSVEFLDHVEAALTASLPNASFRRYNKGDASAVASDELLETIASECGALVAAYGH